MVSTASRQGPIVTSGHSTTSGNELWTPYSPRLVADWLTQTPSQITRVIEGSLVFADVSGFTALSERLARQGRVGAEELVEVLNATTARLLGVAAADGGSLLKFGGDAVLLLFTGEEHEARACRTAVGMRGALREAWRVRTTAGTVRLRISQGVYSGPIHFFLVGDRHRELVMAGPAATSVAALESAADAGEILVSTATAAALEPSCLGSDEQGGILLRRAPAAGAATLSLSTLAVGDVDMGSAVPTALRAHLAAGGGAPEHRLVTIAFVRFDGLDAIIREEGPDAAGEAVDELIRHAQASCDEHGVTFLGTDVYHDGGKLFLVAGAPRTLGNDAEHMLRCLLQVVAHPSRFGIRAGVNRGPTFVHAVGPPFRRTYTAMGDTTNLAARLVQKARSGVVLATPPVLESSRTVFSTTPLEPFPVKGKSALIEAHEVGAPLGTRPADANVALVGRDAELTVLSESLTSATHGRGGAVHIVGEEGIGKSRLVDEFLNRAEGFQRFTHACDEYGAADAYAPFRRLLRRVLGLSERPDAAELSASIAARSPWLLDWAPLLGEVADVPAEPTEASSRLDPGFRPVQRHRAVCELLWATLTEPFVLVLEDAHWLDDSSWHLLLELCREVETVPWVICTTHRPRQDTGPAADEHGAAVLELGPLERDAARRLLLSALGEVAVREEIIAVLLDRGDGNPYYLLELAASYASGPGRAMPQGIESAVAARIDRLLPADREVLRALSVLGVAFERDLAEEAFRSDVPSVLEEGSWRRLEEFLALHEGTARFRQATIRDVAYEATPFRQRADLHRAAATTLTRWAEERGDERAATLSQHWFLAGDRARCWRWSVIAGRAAADKSASFEAARLLERALSCSKTLDIPIQEVRDVAEALGDAASLAGLFDAASDGYRLARQVGARGSVEEVELIRKEGFLRERSARYDLARRWYRRGIRLCEAREEDPAFRQSKHRLELSYAAASAWEGRYELCVRYCERVLEDIDRSRERAEMARAYYLLDWALTDLGSSEAHRYRELALPIYEELGDRLGAANVLNNLGVDAYYEGRWQEAVDLWERSRRARQEAGDVLHAADATHNIAEVLSDQGRFEEADRSFDEALRVFRAAGYQAGMALATSNLGYAKIRRGSVSDGMTLLEEAERRFASIGAERYGLETRLRIAEAHLFLGRYQPALRIVEDVSARAGSMPGTGVLTAAALRLDGFAHAQAGRLQDALARVEASLDEARSAHARWEEALALEARARVLAALGEHDPESIDRATRLLTQLDVVTRPVLPLVPVPVPGAA